MRNSSNGDSVVTRNVSGMEAVVVLFALEVIKQLRVWTKTYHSS